MEKTKLTQRCDIKVHKDNGFISKARYKLTANQQKLLLFLISQIKSNDSVLKEYKISIKDYCKLLGIAEYGGSYRRIKDDIKAIADSSVWIKDDTGKETLLRWFETVTATEGNGTITVKFSKTIEDYLFALSRRFNTYALDEILPMRSVYGIRMYEWLNLFNFKLGEYVQRTGDDEQYDLETIIGKPVYTTPEEISYRFDLGDKYSRYNNLKQKVLLPAIEDINKYSEEIHVEMKEEREGQKVVRLVFRLSLPTKAEARENSERKGDRLKSPLPGKE